MLSDGMQKMLKNAGTLNKKKKNKQFINIKSVSIVFLVVLTLLFSFILIFGYYDNINVASAYTPYTPASPTGSTTGYTNVDYEYIIYTMEVGSYWMFDWDDGSYSDWVEVENSDTFISQNHSWESPGEYEVRVKHRSIYFVESSWSPPLIVTITIHPDVDGDGYSYEIEEAYGKNPEDPNDYPLDTDGDRIPDDDSPDGSYSGDSDDDNDGLSDIYEETLGSNSKDSNDVIGIIIQGTTYYIVDTDGDGNSDILYNSQTNSHTKVKIENGLIYLDTTRDGSWDHTFNGAVARYEPFPWLYVSIGIILIVIIIIFLLFKKGILYFYEEEYVVEE